MFAAADVQKRLVANESSPMKYHAPKPQEILEEDKIVSTWKLDIQPEAVTILPVGRVFE